MNPGMGGNKGNARRWASGWERKHSTRQALDHDRPCPDSIDGELDPQAVAEAPEPEPDGFDELADPEAEEAAPPESLAPEVPLPRAPPVRAQMARLQVACPGGELVYYPEREEFYAVCRVPAHKRCVLTRTAKASASRLAQGRPLGLLTTFLSQGARFATKDEHKHVLDTSFDSRAAARAALSNMQGSEAILACERPSRAGEGSEPDACP